MSDTPVAPGLDDLPRLSSVLDARQARKAEAYLERLSAGISAGGIAMARLDEMRRGLADILVRAWNGAVRNELPYGDEARTPLTCCGFHDAAGLGQRIAALGAGDWVPPSEGFLASALAFQAEIGAVAAPVAWLRDRATRRGPEGEGDTAAARDATDLVATTMRATMDGLRQGFMGEIAKVCAAQAEGIEDACARLRALRARVALIPKEERTDATRVEAKAILAEVERADWFGSRMVDYDRTTYETTRLPDAADRVARFCEEQAEEAMALCIQRNCEKLAPLVAVMGTTDIRLHSARIGFEGVQTEFGVAFDGGGSFRFTNAIVYGVSASGTPYTQFPARFHDVVAPDGTPMKGPSEAKVRQAFAGPDEDAAAAPRM